MVGRRFFVTALALASLYAPQALHAQNAAPKPAPAAAKPAAAGKATAAAKPAAVDPKLQAFAKLHFTLNLARDEYNVALAKAHEPQAKNEAMDEFEKKRAEIFTANNTTEAAYQQELYVVSSDPAQREVFERLMKDLAAQ